MNNQFTKDDLSKLIGIVSSKMGITSEELDENIRNGKINSDRANEILKDKNKLNALINSPQAQAILNEIHKNKK